MGAELEGGGAFKRPHPSRRWKIKRPSGARVNMRNKYNRDGHFLWGAEVYECAHVRNVNKILIDTPYLGIDVVI